MSQDFHNPEETTYDLISRLRKEARQGSHPQPDTGNTPPPSRKSANPRSYPIQSHPHVNFRNKSKGPKQILGVRLSTILMGISTLLALGILAVGLTILFANRTIGSPGGGNYDMGTGEYGDSEADDYTSNPDDGESYADYPENTDEAETHPFTLLNIAEAITPRLEDLLYELEIEVNPNEWAEILAEFASGAYYEYRDTNPEVVDWSILVVNYAETAFLESEWAISLLPPPEESQEDEDEDEEDEDDETEYDEADDEDEETETDETPTQEPSPTPNPSPAPAPPPVETAYEPFEEPEMQFVFINLTKIERNQRVDIIVPFVFNQGLIDLFVRNFHLRLAVDDPHTFPYDEHTMIELANNVARLYITNGANYAEYRLRENISVLERAEMARNS